ncbi:hypothetical protein SISSUDRAFT_1034356 [Sistotremastrum suecicum HHB10207 ss-3]|uniref:Uncharacterized protein n=1 Tax=Sistotremastrum suecicum HHB10207 ss-3 TaxID=1314776 RepID=A0A166C5I1_9AGAM|nr:hypothetical protein SISSUDRAFT_1034356 [Sistotremastrum suecicum HHB10207 ss-3]
MHIFTDLPLSDSPSVIFTALPSARSISSSWTEYPMSPHKSHHLPNLPNKQWTLPSYDNGPDPFAIDVHQTVRVRNVELGGDEQDSDPERSDDDESMSSESLPRDAATWKERVCGVMATIGEMQRLFEEVDSYCFDQSLSPKWSWVIETFCSLLKESVNGASAASLDLLIAESQAQCFAPYSRKLPHSRYNPPPALEQDLNSLESAYTSFQNTSRTLHELLMSLGSILVHLHQFGEAHSEAVMASKEKVDEALRGARRSIGGMSKEIEDIKTRTKTNHRTEHKWRHLGSHFHSHPHSKEGLESGSKVALGIGLIAAPQPLSKAFATDTLQHPKVLSLTHVRDAELDRIKELESQYSIICTQERQLLQIRERFAGSTQTQFISIMAALGAFEKFWNVCIYDLRLVNDAIREWRGAEKEVAENIKGLVIALRGYTFGLEESLVETTARSSRRKVCETVLRVILWEFSRNEREMTTTVFISNAEMGVLYNKATELGV